MIMCMFGTESLVLEMKSLHSVDTMRGSLEKPMTEEKGRLSAHMVNGKAV